ncbi:hypothetical protein V8E51_018882 [Hyaloscypha variabilis]|uniref:Uncharacterized protein n=1 Tax=Hyaloscypha variabilis (strain UAMH 11265 / GT02V1 / F) TaxID=1149755 RepID=A0A2J6R8A8_HYAVF|nr:hypothetical protein L207DRAFT_588259 [Hyaloscypha variabilis F]
MPGLLSRRLSRPQSNHSSPSPSPPPTLYHRRSLSRNNSSYTQPPPALTLTSLGLPENFFATRRRESTGIETRDGESDAECWSRMLMLQREYHCYNSARLEAAVEALEKGVRIEEVPIPSRLCLDLLNEELEQRLEANELGKSQQ